MMKSISPLILRGLPPDAGIIFGVFKDGGSWDLAALDRSFARFAEGVLKKESFKAEQGKTLSFYYPHNGALIKAVAVGLGRRKEMSLETVREAASQAALQSRAQRIKRAVFLLESFYASRTSALETAGALAEACLLALYEFKKYKTEKDPKKEGGISYPSEIALGVLRRSELSHVRGGISAASAVAEGVRIARDMTNEPANRMDPEIFSREAVRIGRRFALKVRVLGARELAREKMGALMAVGQGSAVPPRLVVAEYRGKKGAGILALVGKGITFDSGGISIKPSKDMEKMKYDMAGAASVLGVLAAASLLKIPQNLVAVMPLAENLPSGSAVKPGDVVRSASGLSIEVVNTDAEGRLVLADALHYAKRFKPRSILDLATLTGAATVVLGSRAIPVMGDSALIEKLKRAGEAVNEKVWELPLWKEYGEDIKSETADVQNVGKGEAGTIIGGKFLEKFVGTGCPWAHLDIASTAWVEKNAPGYCPRGARGIGVRLILRFLRNE